MAKKTVVSDITLSDLDARIAATRHRLESLEKGRQKLAEAHTALARLAHGTGDLTAAARGAMDAANMTPEQLQEEIVLLLKAKPRTHAELCELLDPSGTERNRISGALTRVKKHHHVVNLGDRHRGEWSIPTRGRKR